MTEITAPRPITFPALVQQFFTEYLVATHPIGQEYTGRYFEHLRETNCLFARNKQMVNALFESCANYAKHKVNKK